MSDQPDPSRAQSDSYHKGDSSPSIVARRERERVDNLSPDEKLAEQQQLQIGELWKFINGMTITGPTVTGSKGKWVVAAEQQDDSASGGINPNFNLHNYSVVNASSASSPEIIVTPGNHADSGSGNTIVPTISGTAINTSPPPVLTVGSSDTVIYFHGTASGGATSAIEILSGTSVPTSTATDWYQVVAFITVTIISSVARVVSNEGGVGGSQADQYCNGVWLFGLV